jgi:hypothetical protein
MITVNAQPPYPNATYTHLLYTITSTESGQPQYQYVMDVKQGGALLTRIRQYPNPAAAGIFDPSRILNDYINYDPNWKTSTNAIPVSSVQTFDILFGEEYGTSVSSSVVLYDGVGSPGAPGVATTPAEVFGAVVDPNNGISFNWQEQEVLSNIPTTENFITEDEYQTLSVYNDGTLSSVTVNYNPGGQSVYNLQAGFNTIPVGGKNIGVTGWDTITVSVGSTNYTWTKVENCNYDRVRFAFINKFGFWDFFGWNLPIRKTTTMTRQSLTRPMVNYSSQLSVYNNERRGQDFYNIQYNSAINVSTDWLDQSQANWLSELLESPSVFVQDGDLFNPVVITNGSYVHNTNKKSQKTFQYDITFEYANQQLGR